MREELRETVSKSKKWEDFSLSRWRRRDSERLMKRHWTTSRPWSGLRIRRTMSWRRIDFTKRSRESIETTNPSCSSKCRIRPLKQPCVAWTSKSSRTTRTCWEKLTKNAKQATMREIQGLESWETFEIATLLNEHSEGCGLRSAQMCDPCSNFGIMKITKISDRRTLDRNREQATS